MSDFGYNVQRPIFRESNPSWITLFFAEKCTQQSWVHDNNRQNTGERVFNEDEINVSFEDK